ncbi:uncharacterized protein [Hyperolius riggenbachi]|uniref:uncharacterized protein n=1 Tax=Hyperolius riggenbachi TaxID=752182 RepID=UPI0035A351DC
MYEDVHRQGRADTVNVDLQVSKSESEPWRGTRGSFGNIVDTGQLQGAGRSPSFIFLTPSDLHLSSETPLQVTANFSILSTLQCYRATDSRRTETQDITGIISPSMKTAMGIQGTIVSIIFIICIVGTSCGNVMAPQPGVTPPSTHPQEASSIEESKTASDVLIPIVGVVCMALIICLTCIRGASSEASASCLTVPEPCYPLDIGI